MLVSKLHSGTSKAMQLIPVHLALPLFLKSHCTTCSPACVILYHLTGSCKGPITCTLYFIVVLKLSIVLRCQRKLFSRSSHQPIRTVTTGYALSSMFVPGDKHVIIGTKVQLHAQWGTLTSKYLLLTKFEIRALSYKPSLLPTQLLPVCFCAVIKCICLALLGGWDIHVQNTFLWKVVGSTVASWLIRSSPYWANRAHCLVFLGKTLYSQCLSPLRCIDG